MLIKIVMANAFDQVRHSFLRSVLEKFGFNSTFIRWVGDCISGPWIAPLLNGRPTFFFKASRGLQWGCNLSPLVYIFMVKALNIRLDYKNKQRNISGLKISAGIKRVNHSQFADDILLLGGASTSIARRFKDVLDQLLLVFGGGC
jgi:hypothetical protein